MKEESHPLGCPQPHLLADSKGTFVRSWDPAWLPLWAPPTSPPKCLPDQQVRMKQMVKASRCLWPGLPRGTGWPPPISSRCVRVRELVWEHAGVFVCAYVCAGVCPPESQSPPPLAPWQGGHALSQLPGPALGGNHGATSGSQQPYRCHCSGSGPTPVPHPPTVRMGGGGLVLPQPEKGLPQPQHPWDHAQGLQERDPKTGFQFLPSPPWSQGLAAPGAALRVLECGGGREVQATGAP